MLAAGVGPGHEHLPVRRGDGEVVPEAGPALVPLGTYGPVRRPGGDPGRRREGVAGSRGRDRVDVLGAVDGEVVVGDVEASVGRHRQRRPMLLATGQHPDRRLRLPAHPGVARLRDGYPGRRLRPGGGHHGVHRGTGVPPRRHQLAWARPRGEGVHVVVVEAGVQPVAVVLSGWWAPRGEQRRRAAEVDAAVGAAGGGEGLGAVGRGGGAQRGGQHAAPAAATASIGRARERGAADPLGEVEPGAGVLVELRQGREKFCVGVVSGAVGGERPPLPLGVVQPGQVHASVGADRQQRAGDVDLVGRTDPHRLGEGAPPVGRGADHDLRSVE